MPTNILSLLVAFGRQRFQTALLVAAIRYTAALDENRETVFREQNSIHFKLLSNFGGDNLENKLSIAVWTSLNLLDLNVELTKRIDLTAEKLEIAI
jgi:hypothetical protein